MNLLKIHPICRDLNTEEIFKNAGIVTRNIFGLYYVPSKTWTDFLSIFNNHKNNFNPSTHAYLINSYYNTCSDVNSNLRIAEDLAILKDYTNSYVILHKIINSLPQNTSYYFPKKILSSIMKYSQEKIELVNEVGTALLLCPNNPLQLFISLLYIIEKVQLTDVNIIRNIIKVFYAHTIKSTYKFTTSSDEIELVELTNVKNCIYDEKENEMENISVNYIQPNETYYFNIHQAFLILLDLTHKTSYKQQQSYYKTYLTKCKACDGNGLLKYIN